MACLIEYTHRPDGWWFCYLPETGTDGECGPYRTRDEAEDDGRGPRCCGSFNGFCFEFPA